MRAARPYVLAAPRLSLAPQEQRDAVTANKH